MGKSGRTLLVALLALLVSPDVLGFTLNPAGSRHRRSHQQSRGSRGRRSVAASSLSMASDPRFDSLVDRVETAAKAPKAAAPAVKIQEDSPPAVTIAEVEQEVSSATSKVVAEQRPPSASVAGNGQAYDGAVSAGSLGLQVVEGLAVLAAVPAILTALNKQKAAQDRKEKNQARAEELAKGRRERAAAKEAALEQAAIDRKEKQEGIAARIEAARIEEERQESVRQMVLEAQVKKQAEEAAAAKLAAEEAEKEKAASDARREASRKAREEKMAAKAAEEAKAAAEAAELKAKQEAEAKAAAELKAKQEAEAKAAAEAAELKAKQEAEAKAAAELKAKQEAEAKAAAELKAKQEAEAKAAAELKAKQEAEAKAAAEAAELKAKQEAEAKAAAELKAKQEAEAKAAAELKAKQEAEAKAAAELKAKQEAEAKAAAELKAKQEAEAKAAAEVKAKQEAEAKAAAEAAELKAKQEAEAKAAAAAKAEQDSRQAAGLTARKLREQKNARNAADAEAKSADSVPKSTSGAWVAASKASPAASSSAAAAEGEDVEGAMGSKTMTTVGLTAKSTAVCSAVAPGFRLRGGWGTAASAAAAAAAPHRRRVGLRSSPLFSSESSLRTAAATCLAAANREYKRNDRFALRACSHGGAGEGAGSSWFANNADGFSRSSLPPRPSIASLATITGARDVGGRLSTSLESGGDVSADSTSEEEPRYGKGGWNKDARPSSGAARWARWVDAPPSAAAVTPAVPASASAHHKNYGKGTFDKKASYTDKPVSTGYPAYYTPPTTAPAVVGGSARSLPPASTTLLPRADASPGKVSKAYKVSRGSAVGKQSAWAAAASKKKARLAGRVSCAEWMSRGPKKITPRSPSRPVTLSEWMSSRPTK